MSESLCPALVSAAELHAVLGDPRLRVLDATTHLHVPDDGGG